MTFVQLVRPGAPVVLGSFASSMSMQSGAPTFGTPEPALVLYVMAALARRLGVPFRSGGSLCASKIPDAQAAYESAATLQPTVLGRRQLRPPRRGLARGRADDRLREVHPRRRPVRDDGGLRGGRSTCRENGQALDAIRENEPGSTSSGSAHTLANFETAFYRSEIADNNSFEQWLEDGSLDAAQRANAIWKRMLAEYEAPPIDPGDRRGAPRVHRPEEGVDAGLDRLDADALPPPDRPPRRAAGGPRRDPRGTRRSSSSRSRTRSTRPRSCRPGADVSVTASPAQGIEATVALCEQLQARGVPGGPAPVGADDPRPGPPARAHRLARGRRRRPGVRRRRRREGARRLPRRPLAAPRDGRDRPPARRDRDPLLPAGSRLHRRRAAARGAPREGARTRPT